jgi:ankyrin repeat protein
MINQYSIIELLLMHGANINKKDQYGNTALMYAVDRHNLESINSLMKNGCNR